MKICPPHLIRHHSVLIRDGVVFLTSSHFEVLLSHRFSRILESAMKEMEELRAAPLRDPRIRDICDKIHPNLRYTKRRNQEIERVVNLQNINEMIRLHFPPCMRGIVEFTRRFKIKPKHPARQQFTPFLKEAGMTFSDSLEFHRKEFTRDKSLTLQLFEKNYTYDIKWVYGLVGRMKEATAQNCQQIISHANPAKGCFHGCPFKTLNPGGQLEGFLRSISIQNTIGSMLESSTRTNLKPAEESRGEDDSNGKDTCNVKTGDRFAGVIDEIVSLVKRKEYQVGCQEWFKFEHVGHSGTGIGIHPNDYIRESISFEASDVSKRAN